MVIVLKSKRLSTRSIFSTEQLNILCMCPCNRLLKISEVPKIIQQERIQHREVEHIKHVPMPHTVEEEAHAPTIVQEKRQVHQYVEHHTHVLVHERIQHRRVEHITQVPVPQIVEEEVNIPKVVHQERIQHCIVELVTHVPIPHTVEEEVHVPTVSHPFFVSLHYAFQTPNIFLNRESSVGLLCRHSDSHVFASVG